MKRASTSVCVALGVGALLVLFTGRATAQADLAAKIATAKSAADQEAIAGELEQEAEDLEAKAALHAEMAKHYEMDLYAHSQKPTLKKHCEELSAKFTQAAELTRVMAKVHRELAKTAGK